MEKIITERLLLRDFKEEDGEDLYEYLSDEETVKYEPNEPFSRDAAIGEAKRRSKDENFIAVCLTSGKLIGNIYFAKGDFDTWEIGYVFNRKYWGKGYAAEAAKAIIKNGFDNRGARRVIAMCTPLNTRSWSLMERLGMRREGHLLKNIYFKKDSDGNPIWLDTYEYGLLKEEYND